jgi:hypothetical protein
MRLNKDERDTLAQIIADRDRYKAALEDISEYNAFRGARDDAKAALDLTKPLARSVPKRYQPTSSVVGDG